MQTTILINARMNQIASYRVCYENFCAYSYQVRHDYASVLEWNLPFQDPGSATECKTYCMCSTYLPNHQQASGILDCFHSRIEQAIISDNPKL